MWPKSSNIWYILESKIQEFVRMLVQKFKIRWFARFRQNSIFEQKLNFWHNVREYMLISSSLNVLGINGPFRCFQMMTQCFSLRRLQLGLSSLLILVEVLGIGLWIWAPHRLLPWPVGRWEVIHYGHCKAVNASVFVNVSLHVNPLAHCFSGTISRMINRQVLKPTFY